jgi:hypothetical protein
MKKLLIILTCVYSIHNGYSQPSEIDLLIKKLDNKKLYGTCNYNWQIYNASKEADTLIAIGRIVPNKKIELFLNLYNLLEDSTKGIVSHYVLTNIFYKDSIINGGGKIDDNEEKYAYNYGGLIFYENKNRTMFADKSELFRTKERWRIILVQKKLIKVKREPFKK